MTKIAVVQIVLLLCTAPCVLACGTGETERWDIKVLKDAKVSEINWSPDQSSVRELTALIAPKGSVGRSPAETRTVRVKAVAIGLQTQPDGDFHMVIADPDDRKKTMIVEAPDPECVKSDFSERLQTVRDAIEREIAVPVGDYHKLSHPVLVEVTGVPFFDFSHGEHGQAANGIELHPLLEIRVDPAQPIARLRNHPR